MLITKPYVVCIQGKNLMSGGLDMLETLGKKTYHVLAEGDHGIKNTIQKTKDKPNLSQVQTSTNPTSLGYRPAQTQPLSGNECLAQTQPLQYRPAQTQPLVYG